ncbi:Uncharacterized conserved protein [Mycobacteroides abscessus subsp. abscessus]|uniref:DUF262 domain-containing protein n=1 Tax=Mycobacteroides abscessus TaxID=36809 RepID=UPI00092A71E9|nr:DUF262 domain-containing protein [Mycobacteroides abscessus]SHU85556.1 Uncharacterized conserved protein [Mycobacteroides abscessus subsp. abscessus]
MALPHYHVNPSAWAVENFLDETPGQPRFDMDQPYQRGSVWGVKRKQNLVKSLLMDIPVPAILLNNRLFADFQHPGYDEWRNGVWAVVDGKQRVTALRDLIADRFPVPAEWFEEAGEGMIYFSSLPQGIRNRILNKPLSVSVGQFSTLAEEQDFFNLINFGGLAQGETDTDLLETDLAAESAWARGTDR